MVGRLCRLLTLLTHNPSSASNVSSLDLRRTNRLLLACPLAAGNSPLAKATLVDPDPGKRPKPAARHTKLISRMNMFRIAAHVIESHLGLREIFRTCGLPFRGRIVAELRSETLPSRVVAQVN